MVTVVGAALATDGSATATHPGAAGQQFVPVELSHGPFRWCTGPAPPAPSLPASPVGIAACVTAWFPCEWIAAVGDDDANAPGTAPAMALHGTVPTPVNMGNSTVQSRSRATRCTIGWNIIGNYQAARRS